VARGQQDLFGAAGHPDALSIAALYDEVEAVLGRAFPAKRTLWVRGEIQKVEQHPGSGHCYIDLVDPDSGRRPGAVLHVKCWQSTWARLRRTLEHAGVALQRGMVVLMRGTLDFYKPKGEIGFVLSEIDVTALLGGLALRRAELLRALDAEGLRTRNRALGVPDVPLRVGLVASPGSEGYRDFVGQLARSGFAFSVTVAATSVQGVGAPGAISRAIGRLASLGPARLDVVVVVRGGGSKGDLAAFDAEPVARAIATSSVPVWTGIGHTGDEAVADVVANRACSTPTECGRELVQRVRTWWERRVAHAAGVVARRSGESVSSALRDHARTRAQLCTTARLLLDRQRDHLTRRGHEIGREAPRLVDGARRTLVARGAKVGPLALAGIGRAEDRIVAWRRLVSAYDVERQLERGYTLTLDEDRRVVRHAAAVRPGERLVTRFADGTVGSVADEVLVGPGGNVGSLRARRAPEHLEA